MKNFVKNLTVLMATIMLLGAAIQASAATVVVDGVYYDVTWFEGTLISEKELLESQVWFGNSALAEKFVLATKTLVMTPEDRYNGPLFVIGHGIAPGAGPCNGGQFSPVCMWGKYWFNFNSGEIKTTSRTISIVGQEVDTPVMIATLIETFTVTSSIGGSIVGNMSPLGTQEVAENTTTEFTISPFTLDEVDEQIDYIGGTCGGTLEGNVFTTDPITQDCTVSAVFKEKPELIFDSGFELVSCPCWSDEELTQVRQALTNQGPPAPATGSSICISTPNPADNINALEWQYSVESSVPFISETWLISDSGSSCSFTMERYNESRELISTSSGQIRDLSANEKTTCAADLNKLRTDFNICE